MFETVIDFGLQGLTLCVAQDRRRVKHCSHPGAVRVMVVRCSDLILDTTVRNYQWTADENVAISPAQGPRCGPRV